MVSTIGIHSVYQTQCVVRMYAVARCLYRYKNKLFYRKGENTRNATEDRHVPRHQSDCDYTAAEQFSV
jgi:hypothetical protein